MDSNSSVHVKLADLEIKLMGFLDSLNMELHMQIKDDSEVYGVRWHAYGGGGI